MTSCCQAGVDRYCCIGGKVFKRFVCDLVRGLEIVFTSMAKQARLWPETTATEKGKDEGSNGISVSPIVALQPTKVYQKHVRIS
jgi:hypothetical protein